ncbi:hypothetical protein [Actinomadura algeriensis]|uniref:Uncharacterized protein n=1 Tax=Actinomadura algeriensis TaxID=1679523 RepID=A0ABR9JUK2_9ACTN|nr:hypothetical protein [Actinomadura algeriensis]MBE1534249.1 hypothetical protein [Actinomadura algeriensis]
MVGQILAIVALAVFAVPLVLMLYVATRYVIGLFPREVRDDCPACGHAVHDRPGHDRPAGACGEPGCGCPLGARTAEPPARPRPLPPPRDADAPRPAPPRRPQGHATGCLVCGHSSAHHDSGPQGGCTWSRAGWRFERVHRDDDWNTGWIDERRWDPGTPCGCPAYVDPGAR